LRLHTLPIKYHSYALQSLVVALMSTVMHFNDDGSPQW
jgi:hypothetical protein